MAHDWIRFPELTNAQMDFYYFQSPHKQIFEDFDATVVKVHDGDTVTLRTKFRDFDFPLRFLGTNAKELSEGGGDAQSWLEAQILDEDVRIKVDPKQRVGKFGRLLGVVNHRGLDMGEMMIQNGMSTSFENRNEGKIPNINKELAIDKWF